MKKSELNQLIHFSDRNTKSKCDDDIIFLTWSLRSRVDCPFATGSCKKRCFAKKNENMKKIINSRDENFKESVKETFVNDVIDILNWQLERPKANEKMIIVRIHTSGDFYSLSYFKKWVEITNYYKGNEKILFQAYTKSMPILIRYLDEGNALKDINIHFVWSIWHDTPEEFNKMANKLGMQTFTALPKNEINEAVDNGAFLCQGDCGNCKECYTGISKEIVIPYH